MRAAVQVSLCATDKKVKNIFYMNVLFSHFAVTAQGTAPRALLCPILLCRNLKMTLGTLYIYGCAVMTYRVTGEHFLVFSSGKLCVFLYLS